MIDSLATRNLVIDSVAWPEVADYLGTNADVLSTVARAERVGSAAIGGVGIYHVGYAAGVTEYNASTALYRLVWP